MKRQIIIILLIFLTLFGYSQKVKKIVVKFDKSRQISQSYYVLKSNKNIKHGEYVSYFRMSEFDLFRIKKGMANIDKHIRQKGNYQNGKKEGEWIENITSSKGSKGNYRNGIKEGKWIENISSSKYSKGNYRNGKKIGVWDSYYYGEKRSSYDHDNNNKVGIWLTEKENGDVIERYDFDNRVYLEPIIRVNPIYPEIAKENNIQGTVKIRFHINIDCTIDSIAIIQNLSPECDNAALDAMKRLSELIKKYWKNCEDKTEETEINFKLY